MCARAVDRYYIIYSMCTREKDSCICMAYSLLSCQPTRKNRLTYFLTAHGWQLTPAPRGRTDGNGGRWSRFGTSQPLTSDFFCGNLAEYRKKIPLLHPPARTWGRQKNGIAEHRQPHSTADSTGKKSNFACIAGQARLTIPSKARYTLERYDLKEPWINDRGCINILHPERSCCSSLMISIIQLISISSNSPPLPSL